VVPEAEWGAHGAEIAIPNFRPGRGLNLGPLTWQSSTQPWEHRTTKEHNSMQLYQLH